MGNNKKILCITARADYGGGPAHLLTLISEGKKQSNTDFFVACPNEVPYWERFASQIGLDHMIEIPHRKFDPFLLPQIARIIKDNQINIIHSHGKGAGVYARALALLTGKPCVHTLHGIHIGPKNSIKRQVYLAYERLTGWIIKRLIFVSKGEEAQASQMGLFRNNVASTIYNGVQIPDMETVVSQRQASRSELFGNDHPFVVGTISRFDNQKNMWEAYAIASACPKLTFLWIGDGNDKTAIAEAVHKQGIRNITFLGFTDKPAYYLSACDAYLSTSQWEGLPLAVIEALSMRIPAVVSEVVGNNEVILNNQNGFTYPLGNITKAVSCLETLAANMFNQTEIYQSLQSNAIETCKTNFDHKVMAQKTIAIYSEVF